MSLFIQEFENIFGFGVGEVAIGLAGVVMTGKYSDKDFRSQNALWATDYRMKLCNL